MVRNVRSLERSYSRVYIQYDSSGNLLGGKARFCWLKNIREEDDGTIRFDVTAGEEGTPGIQKLPFAESFEEDDTGWSFEQLEGKILWEISGSEVYGSALEAADGKRYLKMNGKKGLLGLCRSRVRYHR